MEVPPCCPVHGEAPVAECRECLRWVAAMDARDAAAAASASRAQVAAAPPASGASMDVPAVSRMGTRRDATLLPPRSLPANSRYANLLAHRARSLGSKGLIEQVKLPSGVTEEEWLAVKTIEFFNELNLLVSAFQDICTEETCPVMSAGSFTYAWADGEEYKVPTRLSAPKYMEHLLTWVDRQLADTTFLPVDVGVPFPPRYRKGLRVIYKRLFRIYAHFFHAHFKEIVELEADAHLDHSFKHFVVFVKEFNLIEDEELEPLKDLMVIALAQAQKGPSPLGR